MFTFDENDLGLILVQCARQKATRPKDIAGFALAYADAKHLCMETVRSGVTKREIKALILYWGELVDCRNREGWRHVPVTFANGRSGLAPSLIPRAMETFCTSFAKCIFRTRTDAYKEFEEIHPFLDGNGRVGHILYALYSHIQQKTWPSEPPPDIFAK